MKKIHISDVVAGDTVLHLGNMVTVSAKDIKKDPFMGISLFGDTYNLGTRPVILVLL